VKKNEVEIDTPLGDSLNLLNNNVNENVVDPINSISNTSDITNCIGFEKNVTFQINATSNISNEVKYPRVNMPAEL
jgi:hypothetical protein